jgi:hypothetical protein
VEEVWIVLIEPSGVRITRSLRTPTMLDAAADHPTLSPDLRRQVQDRLVVGSIDRRSNAASSNYLMTRLPSEAEESTSISTIRSTG